MKDPAILFYTKDFLTGTSFFTDAERGQYIRLLCEQHQNGHIPENHMVSVCLSLGSPVVKKFIKDSDGNYFNERMENEIIKRNNFIQTRINNGVKGGRPKEKPKPNGLPNTKPNGNAKNNLIGNANNSSIDNTIKYSIYYDAELENNIDKPLIKEYEQVIKFLHGENELHEKLECWLKLEKQLSYEQFEKVLKKVKEKNRKLRDMFLSGFNDPKYLKGKKTVYQTLNAWLLR